MCVWVIVRASMYLTVVIKQSPISSYVFSAIQLGIIFLCIFVIQFAIYIIQNVMIKFAACFCIVLVLEICIARFCFLFLVILWSYSEVLCFVNTMRFLLLYSLLSLYCAVLVLVTNKIAI